MTHVLDNPAWHALKSRHSALAIGGPRALRYQPDISPWAALEDEGPEALEALVPLVPEDGYVILARKSARPFESTSDLAISPFEGIQMVAQSVTAPAEMAGVVDLGDDDAADMLALATLTKPGPFVARTHVMGNFIGIQDQGQLVAMAGERLKLDGYTEVSGVCTHPDYRGRGYAGLLSRIVATRIAARGEVAMLHAFITNVAAIRLYEQLGFVTRARLHGAICRRA
jgi:ribosomal protein S18 acetylase RimI-like enzyme